MMGYAESIPRVVALGTCTTCDTIHTHCAAHRKWTDPPVPCRKMPMAGQTICYSHGGSAPQNRAAGAQRVAQQEAEKAVRRALDALPPRRIDDPEAELAALAGEVLAWKDAAAALVADLYDPLTDSGEDVNPLLKLTERGLDRSANILATMSKLGLTERRVQVEEAQHAILGDALRAVLARNNIDADFVLPDLAAELRHRDALGAIEAESQDVP